MNILKLKIFFFFFLLININSFIYNSFIYFSLLEIKNLDVTINELFSMIVENYFSLKL